MPRPTHTSRSPATAPPDPAAVRPLLALLALGYTAFAVYGSLVPLQFRAADPAAAWDAFLHLRYLELGIGSRADWVANILLFVPLCFLWLGALWPRRPGPGRVLVTLLVLATAAALSAALEYVQFYFPPRTQSLNDILAEGLGALVGVTAWWLAGGRLTAWLTSFAGTASRVGLAGRLLYGYLFLLFGYSLLPLDLTLSPAELFHKWREGRLVLLPFVGGAGNLAQRAYDLASDVAIWVPAAFLWRLAGRGTTGRVVLRTLAWATLLELLQLFVYSRVTDVTDLITAALGGLAGATLAVRLADPQGAPTHATDGGFAGPALLLLAIVAWVAVILAAFWYPFDFRSDWGFVHERVAALRRAPFETYYYGTEFRAVTEVLHKTGFFFPLGALLAVLAGTLRRRWPIPAWPCHGLAAMAVAGVAGAVEAGQLFLPGKFADVTDGVLECLGGAAGYGMLWFLLPRWRAAAPPPRSRRSMPPASEGS